MNLVELDTSEPNFVAKLDPAKDPPLAEFDRLQIDTFSYEAYHDKMLEKTPILLSALTGSVSNQNYDQFRVSSECNFKY